MSNLIKAYGYIVIAFISCAIIFFCGFSQFNDATAKQKEYNQNVMMVNDDGVNENKSPIFKSLPDDEIYLTIDKNISYNWEYFTKDLIIEDYKGADIKENIIIRLYKILPDELSENTSQYIYLGDISNTTDKCLFSLDNYNIDINNEVVITDLVGDNIFYHTGYNTYINSGLEDNISNKYKIVYSVIDSNGYKAEYSVVCVMENKDIMNVRNINIHTPIISNNHNSLTELKSDLSLILADTYATISDNTNTIIQNLDCDISVVLFDTISLSELECTNVDDIDNINNNTIVRVIITAKDDVNNKSINKVVELFYSY